MTTNNSPKPSTFDNFWEQRLKDYPQTDEFKKIYQEMLDELPLPDKRLQTPIIISMIGVPGSGKSTFSKLLQEFIPAVHLRSDVIGFHKLPKKAQDDYSKGYVIKHALARHFLGEGYSVIMDDNNRTEYNRKRTYRMAQQYGAKSILFNLRLPILDAVKRARTRDIQEGRETNLDHLEEIITTFQNQIEVPTQEELEKWNITYLEIDASKSPEEIRRELETLANSTLSAHVQ